MTILTLSEYQIGFLRNIFIYSDAPEPHNIKIEHIGITEEGDMIVEYIKYGRYIVEKITRIPDSDKFPENQKT